MSYNKSAVADNGLRHGTLGVWAIVMMVISAVAPMTNIAGALPIAILIGNGPAYVPALILMMVLILIFAVGYVTMARHIPNATAFFVFIRRGLGRPAGGAAALVGLLGYNAMVFAMLGMLGPVGSNLLNVMFGLAVPWWVVSLSACLISGGAGIPAYRFVRQGAGDPRDRRIRHHPVAGRRDRDSWLAGSTRFQSA